MFCPNCGSNIEEGSLFCNECGCKIEEGGAMGSVAGSTPRPPKQTAKVAVSILLCVGIIILGSLTGMIFMMHQVVNKKNVAKLVEKTDFAEIEVGFMGKKYKSQTLAEFICNSVPSRFQGYIKESDIEDLLEEDFIKDFVEEKINGYINDLFHATGEGNITPREIERLLSQNQDVIEEYIGIPLQEDQFGGVATWLKSEKVLNGTELASYRESASGIFGLLRYGSSYGMAVLLIVLAVVLFGILVCIQTKKGNSILYLGIALSAIGLIDILTGSTISSKVSGLNKTIEIGRDIWRSIAQYVSSAGVKTGLLPLVVGIILTAVYLLVKLLTGTARDAKTA